MATLADWVVKPVGATYVKPVARGGAATNGGHVCWRSPTSQLGLGDPER